MDIFNSCTLPCNNASKHLKEVNISADAVCESIRMVFVIDMKDYTNDKYIYIYMI